MKDVVGVSLDEPIARVDAPNTRTSLAADLRRLGLGEGMTVLVHSSLKALGWVCGGPVAVVQALMDVVTPNGTVVMPTHSGDLSDPSGWQNPPVPEEWWPVILESMPAYDPRITPPWGMGRIVETFRNWPGVLRSDHPHYSFAAWGMHAAAITGGHSLDYGLGESSPLARIYDLDGWVLLLGVGYENNTSFHLAEYRSGVRRETAPGAPVMEDGRRVWKRLREIELDSEAFADLGAAYERDAGAVRVGTVGAAECRLFRQRPAVDYAVGWLREQVRHSASPDRA